MYQLQQARHSMRACQDLKTPGDNTCEQGVLRIKVTIRGC